jgi:hypothetical protein
MGKTILLVGEKERGGGYIMWNLNLFYVCFLLVLDTNMGDVFLVI